MTQRISLLYFTITRVRAGVEEHILTLLRGLDRNRFDVHLACRPVLLQELWRDVPGDVAILPILDDLHRWGRDAVRFGRYLREHHIDIVHSHIFRSSMFASPVARLSGVPVIVETSHGREGWRRGPVKANYAVDRLVNRFVDVTIAVSDANRRFLVFEKRLRPEKVVVIRNGCDLEKFRPDHTAPPQLRRDLEIPAGAPVLVVIGRLEPQKGHRILLDALPAVRAAFPDAHLVCVGDGALRPELDQQAAALGIAGAVHFVGAQSNIADWLALGDVCVLPSFYEGLPLVAIEALAAGRAMVATAVDGTSEVILDGHSGLTVEPGDSAGLAQAICRLLGDPTLRNQLGGQGRKWVVEAFDQRQQIDRTEELYEKAWQQATSGWRSKGRRVQRRPAGSATRG
jgi:glycosyltransferase involved in cell wall biosynthesis